MLGFVFLSCLLLYAEGRPNTKQNSRHNGRHDGRHRYRRDDDVVNGMVYAPCKDTYTQCPEWKKTGMCDMAQYKDYMPLVCTETCGFCKANKEAASTGPLIPAPEFSEPASVAPGQKDKIQEDYEAQLQKYYQNLAKQQESYEASIAPAKAEQSASDALAPSVSAEAPSTAPVAAYAPYQYGNQYQSYPYAYSPQPQAPGQPPPGGSTISSSSIGSSSSSTSSVNTDISAGSSNLTPTNSSGNATILPALPSKVSPETPSLPALPPLLVLPPISESLLLDDAKNATTSMEKEVTEPKSEKDKQEADSKPYAPEQTNATTKAAATEDTKKEKPKEETKGKATKETVKQAADRKVTTDDTSTNEMAKSESKHLLASSRNHNPEEENNDEDSDEDDDDDDAKESEQKVIAKAFSSEKKKGKGSDVKLKEKSAESSEDDVYKHDEKSVSDGSGGAGFEEGVDTDDLNYITDFNPDDFDMDVADISRKDLNILHDKRDRVEFPKNHPLFSRSGIQKARSDITAPHIIDATEDGVGDSPLLAAPKSKVNVAKLLKPSKKEEVSKTVDGTESAPTEVDSKFFESKKGGEDGDDADDDEEDEADDGESEGAEDAEKKSSLKEESESKKKETRGKKKDKVKEQKTAKKRTNEEDKDTDATIADLSGAGSGEADTDMLSGDTRSLDESGDGVDDLADADEDEEEEDTADVHTPAHSRQNFQLHGDPEMVDLKPKEPKIQPDLNDFPDSDDPKSAFHQSKPPKAATKVTKPKEKEDKADADKKTSSPDEASELDDIKIEELLNPKPVEKKKKKKSAAKAKQTTSSEIEKGKISLVLQQNFNVLYEKQDSPSYQMLAGNIKKDIEKMIPGTDVSDVAFSEVSVEGNPRQSGKTKANFNIKAPTNEWMKELLKLVDGGDIDGLRVIKGSLEIEEE